MTTSTVAFVSHLLPSSSLSSNDSSCSRRLLLRSNISYSGGCRRRTKKQKLVVVVGSAVTTRSFYAEKSLYEVLGFSAESSSSMSTLLSSSDIKKAYKEMARKYHPDVSPPERVDEYTKKFILVHEAYETLSDPHSRALYDRDYLLSNNFNTNRPRCYHHQDESLWSTMTWRSQLDGLKRRDVERQTSGGGDMSWGARMRSQRSSYSSS